MKRNHKNHWNDEEAANCFIAHLSRRSMVSCVVSVSAVAFAVGCMCRPLFVTRSPTTIFPQPRSYSVNSETLPQPNHCASLPHFVYTTKYFESESNAEAPGNDGLLTQYSQLLDGIPCPPQEVAKDSESVREENPPSHHFIVDIKNVDESFLDSESRLVKAMLDIVSESGLSLLSYHYHHLAPVGVSCVGVLLPRGHISFHTWPAHGVITADLLVRTDESQLSSIVERFQDYFGGEAGDLVKSLYRRRGEAGWKDQSVSLFQQVTTRDTKLIDLNSSLQNIQVYQEGRASNEQVHPAVPSDRLLFLDHKLQARSRDSAQHEALVHPAMITHDDPQRVLVLAGGDGFALREVLKHNSVQHVTLVETDPILVGTSREFLPNDCSDLVGSATSCFDDPRVHIEYADPIAWLMAHFGNGREEDTFDVVIVGSLSPHLAMSLSDSRIFGTTDRSFNTFTNAISDCLDEDEGVLVFHVGSEVTKEKLADSAPEFSAQRIYQHDLLSYLVGHFEVAKEYSEGHDRFLIAFREQTSNWFQRQDEIDLELSRRSMPTKSESETSLFRSFDGATMMQYQYTSRIIEEIYCRSVPQPPLCARKHGIDPEVENVPITSLEVRESNIPHAGRGLFFKKSVPKGTYIAVDELVHSIVMLPSTTNHMMLLQDVIPHHPYIEVLNAYRFAYGFANDFLGDLAYSIEPSILTFINHGCNNTFVQGARLSVTEMTADLDKFPSELGDNAEETSFFHPFADRNKFTLMHANEAALRDIEADEELLDNYLAYYTEENWKWAVSDLRAQCVMQGVGMVNRYQDADGKLEESVM